MATSHATVCNRHIWVPFMLMAIISVFPSSDCAPLEEAKFLRQIADQYSAPLVLSFLHSRIQKNEEMIVKIESYFKNLDQSKVDILDLAEKTLQLLDEQLLGLEKADYFTFNGTEKVKYFIEQFIMQNEMYPIEFGYKSAVQIDITPDTLLADLWLKTSNDLIISTKNMMQTFLKDIDSKEQNSNSNRLQKLAAYLAKRELKLLLDYQYPTTCSNYAYNNVNDPCKVAINNVLGKAKTIFDFFYGQFHYLADPKSTSKTKEDSSKKSHEGSYAIDFINTSIAPELDISVEQ